MSDFRLATYKSANGPRAAIVVGDDLYDAADATSRGSYQTMLGILEDWDHAEPLIAGITHTLTQPLMAVADADLLAPLQCPGTIYCAGANYQDHVDAIAKRHGMPLQPSSRELGVAPFFFLKAARTVVGPNARIVSASPAFDFEIELAAVIGRKATAVSAANALDFVAGYTIANDLSARDRIMRPQLPEGSPFKYDWNGHKNFDGSCPLGPWIVPSSSIGDPQALALKTWVNDELRQNSSTGKMIYSLAEQIETLTKFGTLYPGDVILTGTPEGVGAETGRFLAKNDIVRMEIERIGSIVSHII